MSVASLLKRFFRELPDPLFTHNQYENFIEAAKTSGSARRKDLLHTEINRLPDPNYATLRLLILHLHRVQLHKDQRLMRSRILAIYLG